MRHYILIQRVITKNALCALYSVKNTGCIQDNVKTKYAEWAKPIKITWKEWFLKLYV